MPGMLRSTPLCCACSFPCCIAAPCHADLTNELGQSNSSAAASVNAWSGTCYVTPLLGAFLADACVECCSAWLLEG